jgi:hypothetical protein
MNHNRLILPLNHRNTQLQDCDSERIAGTERIETQVNVRTFSSAPADSGSDFDFSHEFHYEYNSIGLSAGP